MRKTLEEKIEAAKVEKEQAEARIKLLLSQQKTQERKDRNHRLCKRGGQVESLLPGLAKLDDEQFQIFVEMCLLTNHTKKVLGELLPPEPVAAQPESGADTAQNSGTAATTPDAAPTTKASATPNNAA